MEIYMPNIVYAIGYTLILVIVVLIYVLRIALHNKYVAQKAMDDVESLLEYIDVMRLPGIYIIRNQVSGAQYLGSTKKNFWARWGQHIGQLNLGKHENAQLQEDWHQYGAGAFLFQVVQWTNDPAQVDALPEIEKRLLIERAKTMPPMLNYNVAYSRIYDVPSAPEAEPIVPVFAAPKRRRTFRQRSQNTPDGFSLADLGLTPEEIAALGL